MDAKVDSERKMEFNLYNKGTNIKDVFRVTEKRWRKL